MWRRLLTKAVPRSHITQFYQDRDFLARAFSFWFGRNLENGGGAVLLSTPHSWRSAEAVLSQHGFSSRRLQEQGRLVRLDVDAFLDRFLETGHPDPSVFDSMIRSTLATVGACCKPSRVRAWGEAVEVLRRSGRLDAAQVLEGLWNGAVAQHGFSLLCSYRVDNFDPRTHKGWMARLMDNHGLVIPDEDYRRLNEAVDLALVDLYGAEKAGALWAKVWARDVSAASMPVGESMLSVFSRFHPKEADRLLARVRHHYAGLDA